MSGGASTDPSDEAMLLRAQARFDSLTEDDVLDEYTPDDLAELRKPTEEGDDVCL